MTSFEWYLIAAFVSGMIIPVVGTYFVMRSSLKSLDTISVKTDQVKPNWLTGGPSRMIPSDVICHVNDRLGSHASYVVANAFSTFDEDTIYHWLYVQYYKAESFTELSDQDLQEAIDTLSLYCDAG